MQAARLWARGELSSPDDDPDSTDDEDPSDATAGDTTDQALAAYGLAPVRDAVAPGCDDPAGGADPGEPEPGPVFHLWPQCVPAFNLFCELHSQWRVGFQGRTGLDYAAVESHLRLSAAAPRRQWPGLYADLRVLERAALGVWERKRAAEQQREQSMRAHGRGGR